MENLVKEILHEKSYSKEEVCAILDVNADELAETSLSPNTLDGMYIFDLILYHRI